MAKAVQVGQGVPNTASFAAFGANSFYFDSANDKLYCLVAGQVYEIPTSGVGGASWGQITGTLSNQSDLNTALAGKQAAGNYAASTHQHAGVYEPSNANIQSHVASAHAPADAQKNSDITKAEIEAVLTGQIDTHSHAGGSDPWTVRKLPLDFSTTSNAAQNVTQGGVLMGLTPSANTDYMFEAVLLVRTATATVNPRIGFAWSTGMTDGVATVEESQSATAQILAMGNINAAILAAVGGIPNTTQSWPVLVYGLIRAGASPSGDCRVQLASETNGTSVTVKAGSYFRYRSY